MCLRESLLLNCCFLLCRGGVRPMDVVSVTTSPPPSSNNHPAAPRRLFSFLSVAWGFVSDVDIESERYLCFARDGRSQPLRSYTGIIVVFQVSRTGLGSLYAGHSGADSFPPILQGSPVLLAPQLYLIPGCHATSTPEGPLPKHHGGPGGLLPNTHTSNVL